MDKKKTNLPLAGDTDSSFDDEHFILNYRPSITYVEPDQEPFEYGFEEEPETIDNLRDRTQKLINGLDAAVKLADLTQKRIDNRVKASGGLTIKLDAIKDASVIAAMKRRFPDKEDPTQITYDDYKNALDCLNKSRQDIPAISSKDLKEAQADPLRTDFGGYGNQNGQNRPEISASNVGVQSLDLANFQKVALLALHSLQRPLIIKDIKEEILQHFITVPHKPI